MARNKATSPTPKKSGTKSEAVTRRGEWKIPFIEALKKNGNVRDSCALANIDRTTAYEHRNSDLAFRKLWEDALDDAADSLEAEAVRRARDGVDEPVFYMGAECGAIRKYSDTLLIFLLKGIRPEKYRERVSVDVNYKQQFEIFVAKNNLTKEQIESNPIYRAAAARWGIMGISAGGGTERSETEAG